MALTVPSRVRAAPAAEAPVLLPLPALADDFDPYPPKKGKGKLVGALLGGSAVLVVAGFGFRALSEGSSESNARAHAMDYLPGVATPSATAQRDEAKAAEPAPVEPTTVASAAPTTAAAEPTPSATEAAAPSTSIAPRAVTPAREPTPLTKPAARPKAESVAATPTRSTRSSDANSTPPKPTQSKGVIVRDAPF